MSATSAARLVTLNFSPCAKVCNFQMNPLYSYYAKSRTYAIKRHSLLQKRRHIHRESMICRFSVDTALSIMSIVHFYSYTRYML